MKSIRDDVMWNKYVNLQYDTCDSQCPSHMQDLCGYRWQGSVHCVNNGYVATGSNMFGRGGCDRLTEEAGMS